MSRNIIVELDQLDDELNQVTENNEPEVVENPENNQDTSQPDFKVPEKFKNTDRDTVIKSYLELERTLGTQAQELGELRKLADQFLRKELDRNQPRPEPVVEPELTFDEMVTAPGKAIEKAVEPKIKNLESRLADYERKIALAEFQKKHPDFQEVGTNPEFIDWIKASPYRVRQYVSADQNFDFEAADELLTTWKERKSYLTEQVEQQKRQAEKKREGDLKKATLESGSSGEAPKKVYRKIDLINLRISDPEKFDAMYEEISKAYLEGRVK